MIKLLDLLKEYDNQGPATPESYLIEKGKIKKILFSDISKISNLEYDMGGGETNFYPAKNIVIVDNIPVEEFAKEPGDIKGEKVYVEYNLNNPTSLPKANKIIAAIYEGKIDSHSFYRKGYFFLLLSFGFIFVAYFPLLWLVKIFFPTYSMIAYPLFLYLVLKFLNLGLFITINLIKNFAV